MHVFLGVVLGFGLVGSIAAKQYIKSVNKPRSYKHTIKLLPPPCEGLSDKSDT